MLPPDYLAEMAQPTQPMSEKDIADVIAAYARSAANAKAAGFDGIAIHGAHGYLIDSFFWPGTNHRTYFTGGDIAHRSASASRWSKPSAPVVGPNFPIMFRFSQWKLQDYAASNAATPDELAALLNPLAAAGVDIFDASTRVYSISAFAGSDLGLAGWACKLNRQSR